MQGSVRKINNRWYYSFDVQKIGDKRKQVERAGGNTKKEAQEALRIAIMEYERTGSFINESNISVSDFLDLWVEDYVMGNLKHNSQLNYKGAIDKHIKPALGKYRLKTITPACLQTFLNQKKDEGLALKTVGIFRTILASSFKYAVYPLKLIKENPTQYLQMPKYHDLSDKDSQLELISIATYKKILGVFPPGNIYNIPLQIGFHTGMRLSEVAGLTWDCVDLKNQAIRVEKILIRKDGEWVFGTPKTKSSYRIIPIWGVLSKALQIHKRWQDESRIKYGEFYIENDFVCTHENGSNLTPNNFRNIKRQLEEKLNLHFKFHSLRHTHATLLIESGANMKDVQSRLGHGRIAVTLDTYTKVTKKMQSETINIFEEIIKNKP